MGRDDILVVEHRPKYRRGAYAAAASAGVLVVLTFLAFGRPLEPLGNLLLLLAIGASIALFVASRRSFRGQVSASREGLMVGDRLVCAASELSGGGHRQSRRSPCLNLFDADHQIRAQVFVDAAQADRILDGLRPGMRPEAVDFVAISRAIATRGRLALLVLYCLGSVGLILWSIMEGSQPWTLALVIPPAILVLAPSRIRVGAEGVSIRWLFRERLVPFSEVEELRDIPHGIMLRHRGRDLPLVVTDNQAADATNRGDALRRRVRAGYEEQRARVGTDATQLLARGDLDPEAWLARLEELDAPEGYRQVALTQEALWEVLADTRSKESTRGGAALLLARRGLSPASKERMQKLAEAAASDALRRALNAFAKEKEGAETLLFALQA